ncbi:MAG TPA: divalent-cation tolerance protein CutA [Dehalococcoidia bacterium]|nr:divalent-cation tolerance protein CutA [Dehalococcoidia bacterium]
MAEFNQVVIFVTVGTREEAEVIADVLLEQNKAACINIVPAVYSHFRWEGKLETRQEALLIIKTQTSLVEEVTNLVKTVHSYDVPEVIALPIIGGNPEYLAWIDTETETA